MSKLTLVSVSKELTNHHALDQMPRVGAMQAQQNAVMKPVHYEKGQSMRSLKQGLAHWAHYDAKSPNHVEAAHDEDVIQAEMHLLPSSFSPT